MRLPIKHEYLAWVDLEMTGLDYNNDVILEIACIITDTNLNIVAEGPNLIIHQPDELLDGMNEWCLQTHGASGLIQSCKDSTISIEQAEEEVLQFLQKYCAPQTTPLCGNTVWFDKLFLQRQMPRITDFLHYRVVDVTAFKIMLNAWSNVAISFPKKNNHRALDDIRESIAELTFYRTNFINVPKQ